MITIKLWGGMCNQMFQYAFGYALARKHNDDLQFDIEFYENQPKHVGRRNVIGPEQFPNINNLKVVDRTWLIRIFENKYLSHLIRYSFGCNISLGKQNMFIERLHKHYSPVPYKYGLDNYYDGYWQSAEYFKDIEEEIRNRFTPKKSIELEVQEWRKNLKKDCCIAVHVRRGDYLNSINKGEKNTIDNNTYYFEAIEMMHKKLGNPTFCFFSDDINWCRETFGSMLSNAVFVDRKGDNSALFDLFAIAACDHGIMSPSTFSWWGNWLRNTSKHSIVIYPEGDYADKFITNKDWIQLKITD